MKQTYYDSHGGMVSLLLGGTGDPHTIIWVASPTRGKGHAKSLLAMVCNDADAEEATLVAELVRGERFTRMDKLEKLFHSLGFVRDKKQLHHTSQKLLMRRKPKAVVAPKPNPKAA